LKGIRKGEHMNIVVCLKQVPDTETQIRIAPDGKSIVTDTIKWVMNPYDEYAVEEALRLKEKFGGEVTIIAVGPKRVTESIRTALAMGADRGILVDDPSVAGSDSLGTARVLEAVIKGLDYDIILCGKQGVDDDYGLVGSTLAELLGIPQISVVIKIEVSEDGSTVKAHREVEGGTLVIEAPLPVLMTTQKGLNEPRYASLPGIMKAKKKPLDMKTIADLGLDASQVGESGAKIRIMQITPPEERKAGKIVEGETPQEKAVNLARSLHEEAKVI
jgi:electron transfer flavoprotein beta subunit